MCGSGYIAWVPISEKIKKEGYQYIGYPHCPVDASGQPLEEYCQFLFGADRYKLARTERQKVGAQNNYGRTTVYIRVKMYFEEIAQQQ